MLKIYIAAFCACALYAQTGAAPARRRAQPQQMPTQPAGPPGSVRGNVLGASGEPLRKAEVSLRSGNGNYAATTDAAGVFIFTAVPPGSYALNVQRNGYVRKDARPGQGRRMQNLTVASGQELSGVTVSMLPHAVVTGKVVDEDGDPIVRASVQVLRERLNRGRRQLQSAYSDTTNDLGEYRIAGLYPGKYFVLVNPHRNSDAGLTRMRAAGTAERSYTPAFYPGVVNHSQATPLQVSAGQEARGIDLQLRLSVTHRIRGRVLDETGKPAQNVAVMVTSGDPSIHTTPRGASFVRNTAGEFEVSGLTPGSYMLMVNRMSRETGRATAALPVQVGNGDLDGVVVSLASQIQVQGVVRVDSQTTADLSRVRVTFEKEGAPFGQSSATEMQPNGTFRMTLFPGAYRIFAQNLPPDTYLRAVMQGGQDVLSTGVQLAAGSSLEVVLGTKAPVVAGTVQGASGQPLANAVVALVPDGQRRESHWLWSFTSADAAGTFTIRNITPGSYRVLAFPDDIAAEDPSNYRPEANAGVSVSLSEGSSENIQLKSAS